MSIGKSADRKLSITNSGLATVAISEIAVSNVAFSIDGSGSLPVKVAAGTTLSLNVHFKPQDASDSTGQLNVMTSGSSSPAVTVMMHGQGAAQSAVPVATLSGLSCTNAQIVGSGTDSCTVTTDTAAPAGGLVVNLSSSTASVSVPASVIVAAGSTSATFTAKVLAVSTNQTASITATEGSQLKSISIALVPATTSTIADGISSFSCATSSFTGAGTTSCTVALSAPAPSSGVGVSVGSSSSAVSVPASVSVASGASTASFTATVALVTTSQTATVSASVNGSSKTFVIQLTAAAPAIKLSASSLLFGNVAVGTSVSQQVTVTSSGTAALVINADTISGSGFSVSGGSLPLTLNPGQATVLTVQFSPTSTATVAGQLTISSTAPTTSVSLSGAGSAVTPTLSGLSCSNTSITGSLADACTVTLSGSAPTGGVNVSLVSSSSAVTVPSSILVPAAANSATFTATVAAVSSAQSATLTAQTGSTTRSVSLQLNAATALLTANASSISFGAVVVNTATTQTVTLTSSGGAAVTVNSVAVKGTGFSMSPINLPLTLSPGETADITLTFDPPATGSFTGQLSITSTSSSNATMTFALSGTGNPHQVVLNWGVPTGSTAINVYRDAGGGFAVLKSIGAQTTYTDTSVQSGQTYSYYVTSVDSTGAESGPSNTTTVTIP